MARRTIEAVFQRTFVRFLATVDDDVSSNVAPPCDAVCLSGPESSGVNKKPALSTEGACAAAVMLVHLNGGGAVSGTDIGFLLS